MTKSFMIILGGMRSLNIVYKINLIQQSFSFRELKDKMMSNPKRCSWQMMNYWICVKWQLIKVTMSLCLIQRIRLKRRYNANSIFSIDSNSKEKLMPKNSRQTEIIKAPKMRILHRLTIHPKMIFRNNRIFSMWSKMREKFVHRNSQWLRIIKISRMGIFQILTIHLNKRFSVNRIFSI